MAISLNHTVCNLVRYFFLFYSWEWQWKIISSENNILYKSTVQCTMMDLLICWKGPKKLPLTFNCKLISFLQSSNALILLNFSTKLCTTKQQHFWNVESLFFPVRPSKRDFDEITVGLLCWEKLKTKALETSFHWVIVGVAIPNGTWILKVCYANARYYYTDKIQISLVWGISCF